MKWNSVHYFYRVLYTLYWFKITAPRFRRNFHSYGDATITGEGLQILTCASHSLPLSSEGSLAYHTYCDTWQPSILVISKDLTLTPIADR